MGCTPRIFSRVVGWMKAHGQCSIAVKERGTEIWVMMRTWERSTFGRICIAVFSPFSTNTTLEATILGKISDAVGPDVFLHRGPHVLAAATPSFVGNGYRAKHVE